ncbi:hypothetical protein ACM64Y_01075 [Novispirillum sp. DQ9]|uniref:hypothetical protein n=1 Tax=Novispirillum sp. DQ9 TaxID=3398612 RepID=UPI003C7D424B
MAADDNRGDNGNDNGHADALERVPVVVDVRTCLALTEVTGGRGVAPADGAAYTPGVDARGKPVVPAEGPGGAPDWSTLGQPLVIDLSVDIAERYGVNVPAGSSLPLGTLLVRDGRVWFNGHPVAGRDREALWEACRRLGAVQGQAERGKPGGR